MFGLGFLNEAIGVISPASIASFYFTDGLTAAEAPDDYDLTTTRTVLDYDGNVVEIPANAVPINGLRPVHNLLAEPTDAFAGETVTVESGARYIFSAEGDGSTTLTGAAGGTLYGEAGERKAITINATSTSLTLTVSGTVTNAMLEAYPS